MYSLFIDTHNELIKIILFKDGKILTDKEKMSNMQHSVYTMPMIEEALKENNIDVIGIGIQTAKKIEKTYPHGMFIEDINHLPTKLVEKLREIAL